MQMGDGFAAVRTVVDHQPIPAVLQAQLPGDRGGLEQEISQEGLLTGLRLTDAGNGLLGDDQDMDGSLGIDVAKSENLVVLEHDLGGDFAGDDPFKESLPHGNGRCGAGLIDHQHAFAGLALRAPATTGVIHDLVVQTLTPGAPAAGPDDLFHTAPEVREVEHFG